MTSGCSESAQWNGDEDFAGRKFRLLHRSRSLVGSNNTTTTQLVRNKRRTAMSFHQKTLHPSETTYLTPKAIVEVLHQDSDSTPHDSPSRQPLIPEKRRGRRRQKVQFNREEEQPKDEQDPESLQLNDKNAKNGSSNRLSNPRMSLLGKPINYRSNRRDIKYRKLQAKLYNFLERPTGRTAAVYHVAVFVAVFMCLCLSVFSTIEDHDYEEQAEAILFNLEIVIVVWFGLEFVIRLWSSGCRSRYQGCLGRLRFLRSPFCIIDVITICASVVVLSGPNGQMFAASALRGLRFFQILRMVRMDRRGGTWKLLGSVVYAHRQELITTVYIGFLGLIFSSFIIYMVEKDHNPDFRSFAHALWWGVITLCTVGYGDAVPTSWKGKMIASLCALLGISFFALPAGILGSGFALKVQQQQRQKHMIRRRVPAATLIQCLWRCYAADENSSSEATWKIHMVPQRSPPPFKNNTSFVTRFNTLRRGRSTMHSPASNSNKLQATNASTDNLSSNGENELTRDGSETRIGKKSSDDEEDQMQPITLTRQHKGAIRAIRKLKYMSARRRFKEALKPYDVKDVIESYSAGHADLVTKVRGIQQRLDQILGRQGSKAKDVYDSKQSLASRIVKTERQVDDIEEKLERLITMYEEDRKRFATLPFGSPHAPPTTPCPSSPSPPYQAHLPINLAQGRPKSILVDSSSCTVPAPSSSPNVGGTPTSPSIKKPTLPKRPVIKKRVTLSAFPPEYMRPPSQPFIQHEEREVSSVTSSVSSIVPPSVRIEGCTPSDSSGAEGPDSEICRCLGRGSIDSTVDDLLEDRKSDIGHVSELSHMSLYRSSSSPTASSSTLAGAVVITPTSLSDRPIPNVIIEGSSGGTTPTMDIPDTPSPRPEPPPRPVRRTASGPNKAFLRNIP